MSLTKYRGKEVEVLLSTPTYASTEKSLPKKEQPGSKLLNEYEQSFSGIAGKVVKANTDSLLVEATELSTTYSYELFKPHIAGIKTWRKSDLGKQQSDRMKERWAKKKGTTKN